MDLSASRVVGGISARYTVTNHQMSHEYGLNDTKKSVLEYIYQLGSNKEFRLPFTELSGREGESEPPLIAPLLVEISNFKPEPEMPLIPFFSSISVTN